MDKMKKETAKKRKKSKKLEQRFKHLEIEKDLINFLDKKPPEPDIALYSNESEGKINKNTWLADSGASSHMTNNDEGMFNVKIVESKITIGDGKTLTSHKVGSIKMTFQNMEGTQSTVTLHNVKYAKDLCVNLLSIPVALQNGFQIGNKGNNLNLKKGNFWLFFNKLFLSGKAYVCGIDLL
jgi:hypothetical protein